MKRLLCGLFALGWALTFSAQAMAMTIGNPTGDEINGWFKGSFSIPIHYGNSTVLCTGNGNANTTSYSPGENGIHTYYFMFDQYGNPYYMIDPQNSSSFSPTPISGPIKCGSSITNSLSTTYPTSYSYAGQETVQLDSEPPTVSISSPSSNLTTSASDYTISGIANSTSSGVASVRILINGNQGPLADLSNGTFSAVVPLVNGTNTIQALATDNVGYNATSNTVVITRQTIGSSSNNSTTGSSSPKPATVNSSQSPGDNQINGNVKLNAGTIIHLNNANLDQPSNPSVVLAESGFPHVGKVAYTIILSVILLLILLAAYLVWRFRPVFLKLDRQNSGLRRRIILIVTLPSLLPLIGLGYLGYQQLSNSLKASLSQELARAAETSSIKLEREFAIRRTVITTNASNILQVDSQYQNQFAKLANQDSACQALIKSAIPTNNFQKLANNSNCLPFLASIAQLFGSRSSLNGYENALSAGYNNALASMKADEQQRINSYLEDIKSYFPETQDLDVINNQKPAKIVATLPSNKKIQPIDGYHPSLISQPSTGSNMLYDPSLKDLFVTYPVINQGKFIGDAVAAFNMSYSSFIPAIWLATPKPYTQDKVYFVNSSGQQIYPTDHPLSQNQAKQLTSASSGALVSLKLTANSTLAARTSSVTGTNWTVAVGAPPSTILAPIAGIQRLALLAIAGFLLLSLVLGIVFVSNIATEIQLLLEAALRFAKGELGYRIKERKHDELGLLGDTMNQMANDIQTAQAALVQKDKDFINIATHELKAPMTAIIGNLSMITEDHMGRVDATAQSLLDQAYNGTIRLRNLVSDMLDVARLESGKTEFKLEPVNVGDLTQSIVDMQQIPAQQAGVQVDYQKPITPLIVTADKGKLEIIMTNFISNAIKYNRRGGNITVAHELKDGRLTTSVADTGLGIPDDQQARIFEKFYRVKHDDRANVPGTGLGMYITKQFIEGMGGTVWFKSVHGQGTTFYFNLPLNQPAANTQPTSPAANPMFTMVK